LKGDISVIMESTLCIKFAKGKEHLRSLSTIVSAVMDDRPNSLCKVELCCNPDYPEHLTCSLEKKLTKDELEEFIEGILTCSVWEDFD
jgi:hypothetical protein